MDILFSELNQWHWLILAAVLFGFEMMTGTFDLLMVSIAAAITAAFTAFAPEAMTVWTMQALCFAIAAAALVVFGRVFLSGLRKTTPEHPTLNKRMESLIGKRGMATADFDANGGQIKIGDTVWGARAVDGEIVRKGDAILVEGAESTIAVVRRAI